jgi:glycosyltransferase involved in cell wall biosynthesis
MQDSTTVKPHILERQAYLQKELTEISAIYRRCFPNHALQLLVEEGEDPVRTDPIVLEAVQAVQPQHLSSQYLGRIDLPGPHPAAPMIRAVLRVPRAPTKGEVAHAEAPWRAPRALRPLFRVAPGAYEYIRYGAERYRARRIRRHMWKKLPFGKGAPMLVPPVQPDASARPAILIGFHWLEVGGAEKLAFDTVNWALAAGLRVFVVASVSSIQRLADRLPSHPDVTFIRLDRYLPPRLWPLYLERLAIEENIRLVHIHHCAHLYASLAHLRVSAPWIRVLDSTHIVEYVDGGYPRVSGVWSNYIDLHHVISRELVEFFRDRFHVPHKVKLGRMLARHDGEVALPALNMTVGAKVLRVAFIGRYYYQKRPVVLARTLGALSRWARRNGVELRATLVGEGPFRPAVERMVRSYGLGDNVEFLSASADVPGLLRKSDILLLPSNNEGLALVCYEAIEQGCIPISTDVGSQREIVPPGLLVPHDPGAAVRRSVAIVNRLWRDGTFLAEQGAAMQACYRRLAADPTAEEVLMPIYRAAATGAPALDDIL